MSLQEETVLCCISRFPRSAGRGGKVLHELNPRLSLVDISAVMSNHMDEIEKNLNRVLGMTERNGMILFFDEAEVLFGKRCQVAGSHDRYADAGVAHLLQRIENPQILMILTTGRDASIRHSLLRSRRSSWTGG